MLFPRAIINRSFVIVLHMYELLKFMMYSMHVLGHFWKQWIGQQVKTYIWNFGWTTLPVWEFLCVCVCLMPPVIVQNQFSDWFLIFSAFSAPGFVLAPLSWFFFFCPVLPFEEVHVHFNFSLPTQNQPLDILRLAGQLIRYFLQPNSRDLLRFHLVANWLFHTRKRWNSFKYLRQFKCYLYVVDQNNNNVTLAKF